MADEKNNNKNQSENPLLKFLPPVKDKNYFWSVVLFALGVLSFFMTFVKGSDGWLKVHNFLLGMFGFAVIFVPAILIYTSIQMGLEKNSKFIFDCTIWEITGVFLISGAIQVFASGELIGESFEEHITNLYKEGVNLSGGGVASYIVAGPLISFFGKTGSRIIMLILFFVAGMFFTHKSLIEFIGFITKPFRNFGKVVQVLYSMLMGGDLNEIFNEDDLNDDIEKESFIADMEAINIINSRPEFPVDRDFVEISIPVSSNPEPEDEFWFDIPLESDIQEQNQDSSGDVNNGYNSGTLPQDEDFIEKAIELAVNSGQISTSAIQRKLKLGYARAGRIMDELEEMGVVGAKDGAKPRKVLMSKIQYDERKSRRQEVNNGI